MKYLLTLLITLSALPAMAQQVLYDGITTEPISLYVVNSDGTPATSLEIAAVHYKKGTGTFTELASVVDSEVDATDAPGWYQFIANESGCTSITSGKHKENVTFYVTMSGTPQQPPPIHAVLEGPQTTLGDLVTAVVNGIDAWWKSVSYFVQSPKGDTQYTNHATDPTSGSNPTSYTDAPAGGTDTTP